MNRKNRRKLKKQASKQNRVWPKELTPLPKEKWPGHLNDPKRISVWISRKYLAQCFLEDKDTLRISVNRTGIDPNTMRFADEITWDELQNIKNIIGFSNRCAVEIYPQVGDIVNIANMRHLWLLPEGQKMGWVKNDK